MIDRNDLLIDKHERNKRFIGESIEVLKKCMMTESADLRASVNVMIKKLTEDNIRVQQRLDSAERRKHRTEEEDAEENHFLDKFL